MMNIVSEFLYRLLVVRPYINKLFKDIVVVENLGYEGSRSFNV